tara:strand:+ start:967 stop:2664 length:1698 start_codon:yes stop_codon:yes gene_type:complete
MNIILTGSTGFIGQEILKTLSFLGHNIYSISKSKISYFHSSDFKKHFIIDLSGDLSELKKLLGQADVFIHCAGDASFGNGWHYKAQNFEPTKKIVDLINACSPKVHFIFISSLAVTDRPKFNSCKVPITEESFNSPTTDYGKSKLLSENYIKNSGITYTILRPSMVIGEGMRILSHFSYFFKKFFTSKFRVFYGSNGKLPYIHVSDLANIVSLCINDRRSDNETFFCNSDNISLRDLFQMFEPNKFVLNLKFLEIMLTPIKRILPFALKTLFFSALKVDNSKIKKLGWAPSKVGKEAFYDLYIREKSRSDLRYNPSGYSLITGSSSGLGLALAKRLKLLGRKLILLDKNENSSFGSDSNEAGIINLNYDLSLISSMEVNNIFKKYSISEVFLCAGIGNKNDFGSTNQEINIDIVNINLISRIRFLNSAIQSMRINKFGRILIVSSSTAFQSIPYMSTYAASNSALLSLGESISKEEHTLGTGINILTALPGGMDTNFQSSSNVKKNKNERLMSPQAVAEIILKSFNGKQFIKVISNRSKFMNLASKILPRRVSLFIWEKLMRIAR